MLANTIMVANDFKFNEGGGAGCGKGNQSAPVGFGQPTILVKSLTVGGIRS
jgi:predicted Zn-dependent protease